MTKTLISSLSLKKCSVCGEYRKQKNKNGTNKEVLCICDGAICSVCKVTKIRRPNSNHYNEKSDEIWHTPYFLNVCSKCIISRKYRFIL